MTVISDEERSKVYAKVVRRFAPLLFICFLVSILDRVNISYAKLQMSTDIGLSDAAYAFGASIFFWGYTIFEVPSNMLLHTVGAKFWISRIMVSWGIVSGLIAFIVPLANLFNVSAETIFYILRMLLGICEAGFFPGVILFINYWVPASRQSRILSTFLLGIPLSSMIGGPLSGAIMSFTHQIMGLNGWQWMLLIEAIPAVVLGIVLFFWLQDRPAASTWLTSQEADLIRQDLEREAVTKVHSYSGAVKDKRFWILAVIALFFAAGNYGLLFWMPSLIMSGGITDPFHNGLLVGLAYAVGAVAMVLNSWHSARKNERNLHAAIPAALAGVGLILSGVFSSYFPVAFICLVIGVSGIMAMIPIFWTFPGTLLTGSVAAAGIALLNSCTSLSGIVGSFITSWAKDATGTLESGNYVLGILLILAGLLYLTLSGGPEPSYRSYKSVEA